MASCGLKIQTAAASQLHLIQASAGMRAFLAILLIPSALLASEPTIHSYGLYGRRVDVCFKSRARFDCEGETANTLLISPLPSGDARVDLSLAFTNGHTCHTRDAIGKWQGDRLLVTADTGTGSCNFTIEFSNDGASLLDQSDSPCHQKICGARGWLDGYTLPFRGAL